MRKIIKELFKHWEISKWIPSDAVMTSSLESKTWTNEARKEADFYANEFVFVACPCTDSSW